MCVFIQNQTTGLYLSYDAASDSPLWVVGTETATCFTEDAANATLAVLNAGLTTNVYVGRPGDRGGKHE